MDLLGLEFDFWFIFMFLSHSSLSPLPVLTRLKQLNCFLCCLRATIQSTSMQHCKLETSYYLAPA